MPSPLSALVGGIDPKLKKVQGRQDEFEANLRVRPDDRQHDLAKSRDFGTFDRPKIRHAGAGQRFNVGTPDPPLHLACENLLVPVEERNGFPLLQTADPVGLAESFQIEGNANDSKKMSALTR